MLDLVRPQPTRRKCDGSSRREFLQVGTLGMLGLTLADLLRAPRGPGRRRQPSRKQSVILLFLDGGASQLETFDPKMDVPVEYRSLFGAIEDEAARRRVRQPVAEDGRAGRPDVDRPHASRTTTATTAARRIG